MVVCNYFFCCFVRRGREFLDGLASVFWRFKVFVSGIVRLLGKF